MMNKAEVFIDAGVKRPCSHMLYGHFLEHFHRQIYGGVFETGSPLSDDKGYRLDVIQSLKDINVPIIRWPGGCFASAYHWRDGVGVERPHVFDKAWRVIEDNSFGTDEFIELCRRVGAEPCICVNAGTGSAEECSDWVEYVNGYAGRWAELRARNGHAEPYKVKYWCLGNENLIKWELGEKRPDEWVWFVRQVAKLMKRVDPTIYISVPVAGSYTGVRDMLETAGEYIDFISVHGYWDPLQFRNSLSDYGTCISRIPEVERSIYKMRAYIEEAGYADRIRLTYDEWNLRGWHHPYQQPERELGVKPDEYLPPRDLTDANSSYTMADAVFAASFLNACVRNSDIVAFANFSPVVNGRGAIYAYKDGVVTRSTYGVFKLYSEYMHGDSLGTWIRGTNDVDVSATMTEDRIALAIVNKNAAANSDVMIDLPIDVADVFMYVLNGTDVDSYNDVDHPNAIDVGKRRVTFRGNRINAVLEPHSVNLIVVKH